MFSSRREKHSTNDSFNKSSRVGKTSHSSKYKRSFRDHASTSSRRPEDLDFSSVRQRQSENTGLSSGTQTSPIVTVSVGPPSQTRLFAAHESVLSTSPFFRAALHAAFYAQVQPSNMSSDPQTSPSSKANNIQLALAEELPEIFSCVLEYMYKGDYSPRLEYDKRRREWTLENSPEAATSPASVVTSHSAGSSGISKRSGNANSALTVLVPISSLSSSSSPTSPASLGSATNTDTTMVPILKDTLLYCTAIKYSLPELQRLALRKQGLVCNVPVATVLASARYAYANTPDTDSKLRGHYLQLIVRCRAAFRRSGSMQGMMRGDGCVIGCGPGVKSCSECRSNISGESDGYNGRGGGGTGLWFDLFVAMCNHLDDVEQIAKMARNPR